MCFGLVLSLLHPKAIAEDRLTPEELQAAMLGAIAMLREMISQASPNLALPSLPSTGPNPSPSPSPNQALAQT